jgi:hypothetical protein
MATYTITIIYTITTTITMAVGHRILPETWLLRLQS